MSNVGKSYRGQVFVPIVTPEQLATREGKIDAAAGAIPIEVWFKLRGHASLVSQAGMRAYTQVRAATPEAWDRIFEAY